VPRGEIPFHPGATQDYEEAYAWYFAHGIGLAAEFEREIDCGLRLMLITHFGGQNSTLSGAA